MLYHWLGEEAEDVDAGLAWAAIMRLECMADFPIGPVALAGFANRMGDVAKKRKGGKRCP